jgi:hypothetical protein
MIFKVEGFIFGLSLSNLKIAFDEINKFPFKSKKLISIL